MKKQQLIKLSLVALALSGSYQMDAQTSLNAGSNSAVIDGNLFEYSIGEMSLVSTETSSNLIVTQGYLQPAGIRKVSQSPGSNLLHALNSPIQVYPNPTENTLFIEQKTDEPSSIDYQLFDAQGRMVLSNLQKNEGAQAKYQLNLSALAAGSYFLHVRFKGEDQSFKIQKIH